MLKLVNGLARRDPAVACGELPGEVAHVLQDQRFTQQQVGKGRGQAVIADENHVCAARLGQHGARHGRQPHGDGRAARNARHQVGVRLRRGNAGGFPVGDDAHGVPALDECRKKVEEVGRRPAGLGMERARDDAQAHYSLTMRAPALRAEAVTLRVSTINLAELAISSQSNAAWSVRIARQSAAASVLRL